MKLRFFFVIIATLLILHSVTYAYFISNPKTKIIPTTIADSLGFSSSNHIAARLSKNTNQLISETKPNFTLIQAITDEAIEVAQIAPLDASPYRSLGLIELQKPALEKAEAFLTAAHLRDPRNITTIRALAIIVFSRGNYRDGIRYLDQLSRVNYEGEIPIIITSLLSLTHIPEAHSAIIDSALKDPKWRDSYIVALIKKEGVNPNLSLELLDRSFETESTLDPVIVLSWLFPTLINAREYNKAFIVWSRFRNNIFLNYDWKSDLVFDPEMTGIPANVPFNWSLNSGLENGYAEFNKVNGLSLRHDGSKAGSNLAYQILFLGQDAAFTISVEASGTVTDNTGSFRIELRCAATARKLVEFKLNRLTRKRQVFEKSFTLEADQCRIGVILVFSDIEANSRPATAVLHRVSVRPEG